MLVKIIEAYLIVGLVLTGPVMYLVSNTEQYKEDEYSIPVIITAVIICIIKNCAVSNPLYLWRW